MTIPLESQIACVAAELSRREHSFPEHVRFHRMTPKKAAAEIEIMHAVLETLQKLKAQQDEIPYTGRFDRVNPKESTNAVS